MKKILIGFGITLIVVIFVVTFNASYGANYRNPNISNFELTVISNDKHSNESMDASSSALIEYFKENLFGCKLNKISYDTNTDIYLDGNYSDKNYQEIIVLQADFKTDSKQEVLDLNKDYKNYKFVLAKQNDGVEFRVIDKYE